MRHILLCTLFYFVPFQLWAAGSEYQMTDICRATLNVMLKRDISTMMATPIGDGSARVKYTRPQDGKAFSYRCRSTNGNTIGILDETLAQPRWYGEQPTDIQRSYMIKADTLIIRTVYQGEISEQFYSHIEFPLATGGNDGVIEALRRYGTRLAQNYPNGGLKVVKSYHVTTKPLNAYRLDFDTSVKELLTQPGAAENDAIYKANLAKTENWSEVFCTPELKGIINDNHIDMVSGFITRNGENHSSSVCFK